MLRSCLAILALMIVMMGTLPARGDEAATQPAGGKMKVGILVSEYTATGPHAGAQRPGLIFLDIEMPGLDGQATLKRIRSDPKFRDVPVVMMTGVSDERQMQEAAANGANSYTIKPANAEQFLRTVLASTNYWLTIHQYPKHHLPQEQCRR